MKRARFPVLDGVWLREPNGPPRASLKRVRTGAEVRLVDLVPWLTPEERGLAEGSSLYSSAAAAWQAPARCSRVLATYAVDERAGTLRLVGSVREPAEARRAVGLLQTIVDFERVPVELEQDERRCRLTPAVDSPFWAEAPRGAPGEPLSIHCPYCLAERGAEDVTCGACSRDMRRDAAIEVSSFYHLPPFGQCLRCFRACPVLATACAWCAEDVGPRSIRFVPSQTSDLDGVYADGAMGRFGAAPA